MNGLIAKQAESRTGAPSGGGFLHGASGSVSTHYSRGGFTLLEMLVSLIIGTLILGGVMGMISVSMQHQYRLKEKRQIQPVLESAAQMVLADPTRATEGIINIPELPGAPSVAVSVLPVDLPQKTMGDKRGQLSRVMLSYKTGQLEFSIIIPGKNMN